MIDDGTKIPVAIVDSKRLSFDLTDLARNLVHKMELEPSDDDESAPTASGDDDSSESEYFCIQVLNSLSRHMY